ncbi:putative Myb/SANT-like domain-containing protein [Dioscorea sansibarensis]
MSDVACPKLAADKRGTPNKRWRPEYNNFLIPLLVDQAREGFKCDKSFKRAAFAFTTATVNARFKIDFSPENVENHYRTIKADMLKLKS